MRRLILAALVCGIPSLAAVAHVQSSQGYCNASAHAGNIASNCGSNTSQTFSFTATNANDGVLLSVIGSGTSVTATAVTLSATSWTFTQIGGLTSPSSGNYQALFRAYSPNTSAATVTVTWTLSAGTFSFMDDLIDEFSGVDINTFVDAWNTATGSGTATISVTPNANNEMVWCAADATVTGVGTIGGSAATSGANDTQGDWTEYLLLSGGANTSTSCTFTSSGSYAVASVSIRSPMTGITFVQSNSIAGSSVTSLAASFASSNTGGNLIVVFVRESTAASTVTFSDTAGNTYTEAATAQNAADGHVIWVYYAANIKAGANTVTATFNASNGHPFLAVYEFSGIATSSPLDQAPAGTSNSTFPVTTPVTGTTTGASELVFAGLGQPATNGDVVEAGSPFTRGETDRNTSRSATEWRVVSATGTFSPNWLFVSGANGAYSSLVVTFIVKSVCGFGSSITGGQCRGYLTTTGTGQTWTVPADWSTTNTIEVIGGGANGASGASSTAGGSGGGGGGYAVISSQALSGTVGYAVGVNGTTGGSTYFCSAGTGGTSPCSLSGTTNGGSVILLGCGAIQGTSGGGSATACANSGNALGTAAGTTKRAGGNAAAQASGSGGGGGGAAGSTAAGSAASGTTGGKGDGTITLAGSNGTEWDSTHGSGGGGTGQTSGSGSCTGSVGLYGAGGGGGAKATSSTGCAGKQGLIVITYTPALSGSQVHTMLTLGVGE